MSAISDRSPMWRAVGWAAGHLGASLFRPVPVATMEGWNFGWWDRRDPSARARRIFWHGARRVHYDGPVVTRWHNGLRKAHHLSADLSFCTYVGARFEPNEMAFMASVLGPGMTLVDAGANEGIFSILAASLCGVTGEVHAIEPSSRERRKLEENVRLNALPNVRVHPVALGEATGTATLNVAVAEHPGHNTLGAFAHQATTAAYQEEVAITTLDDLVASAGIRRIDLWKMDIEGSEANALRGARGTLRSLRPRLLMELQQESLQTLGSGVDDVLGILHEADYVIYSFTRDGHLQPFDGTHDLATNIVALPSELAPAT